MQEVPRVGSAALDRGVVQILAFQLDDEIDRTSGLIAPAQIAAAL